VSLNGPTSEPGVRVLIVVTSAQRRGAEIEGFELSKHLCELGLDAHAVALATSDSTSRLDLEVLGTKPLGIDTLRALRRRALGFDVVVAYGSSTLTACALALAGTGVPFVYRSIGDPARWLRDRLHRMVWTCFYRRADRVVALWPGGERSIRDLFGVSADRIQVIPNARDDRAFAPATTDDRTVARERLGVPADAPVAAIIGSLSEEKQVGHAIEAIARLRDVVLVVAGDGPLRVELEEHAERLAPGRVRFLGNVDDVQTVLHASDVLVMTSRTEGMPGAVIEAGLCGIPTVAPAIGAMESLVIHEKTGMITESTTPEDVARAIEALLPIAALAGAAARNHLEAECSWTSVAPQWVDCLQSLAAASAAPASG